MLNSLSILLRCARDYEDEFYASWKSYRAANPVETVSRLQEEDSETERLLNVLMGNDDDGPALAGAEAAAAIPAEAARPVPEDARPAPVAAQPAPVAAAPAAAD